MKNKFTPPLFVWIIIISLAFILLIWFIKFQIDENAGLKESQINTKETNTKILDRWLENSNTIIEDDEFIDVLKKLYGNDKIEYKLLKLEENTSIGDIANQVYGDEKYWRLIWFTNRDKPFPLIKFKNETQEISSRDTIPSFIDGIEYFVPAKFLSPLNKEDFYRIRGNDINKCLDILLDFQANNPNYNPYIYDSLRVYFKNKHELALAVKFLYLHESRDIRDLSNEYYKSEKYYPIISWCNPEILGNKFNSRKKINKGSEIEILLFLP